MPELRKDPLTDRWVIISAERAKRPGDFALPAVQRKGGFCPFCEGHENTTPPETFSLRNSGKPDTSGWRVRVVPNKFPALANEGLPNRKNDGIYEMMNGAGAHEVIIETTNHDMTLADLGAEQFTEVLCTYKNRILALKKDPRLEYVLIFRNNGLLAGASLEHPHTQVVGLPIIPLESAKELEVSKNFHSEHGRCIFCDMIARELGDKTRIVAEDDYFVALCPYAPRFPFETWILPKRHSSHFESASDSELASFADFFKKILTRFKTLLNDPPYNFMLHTAPAKADDLDCYHWHIEITPCLTYIAGFERGTGYYINPTPPEDAAKDLRETRV